MKLEDLKNTAIVDDEQLAFDLVENCIYYASAFYGTLNFSHPDALRAAALYEMQQTLIKIQEMAARNLLENNLIGWAEVLRLTSEAINMSNNTNEKL